VVSAGEIPTNEKMPHSQIFHHGSVFMIARGFKELAED
jgi:hypothetical protein